MIQELLKAKRFMLEAKELALEVRTRRLESQLIDTHVQKRLVRKQLGDINMRLR